MDTSTLQPAARPAMRTWRICASTTRHATTILKIVRRHAESTPARRPIAIPRRTGAFA